MELKGGVDGTGPKEVIKCCSCLGGVKRGGDVALWKNFWMGLGKGGVELLVLMTAEGILCGFGGRWLKVAWGVGPCPVDLGPQGKGLVPGGLRTAREACSLFEHDVVVHADAYASPAWLDYRGSAREEFGASEDYDDGGTSEVGQSADNVALIPLAGELQSARHSRRLATGDSTPILEKAMVRKERRLGCGGALYGDRGRVKAPRIQAKSRLCGVCLDSAEANSLLEFADTTNA